MAVRTTGLPWTEKTVRTYATAERAVHEATKLADQLTGMVNIRPVPVVASDGRVRYTVMFFGFSEEHDCFRASTSGSNFPIFR